MPVERKNRNREMAAVLVTTAVLLGGYALYESTPVQDWVKGWQYEEAENARAVRQELELTSLGERIYLAAQPVIEGAEDFNLHCENQREDVALLGCYNDDKIYVYEVQLEALKDSNKVTAAHEFLHAVWVRMSNGERERVKGWLAEVKRDNPDWAEKEVELYKEAEHWEEMYTRAGTKLRDLPLALEQHYAQYFKNRLKIVEYYENYQTPFEELRQKNEQLRAEVLALEQEIEAGRREYEERLAKLEAEIGNFNHCARTEGCFRTREEFAIRREILEKERADLSKLRDEVNAKVELNNAKVAEYQENNLALGELSEALDSKIGERIENDN